MKGIREKERRSKPRGENKEFLEILLDISNRVAMCANLTEALDTVVRAATSRIGTDRGSIFLNDFQTDELYTRIVDGKFNREIRMLNTLGIAGHVFATGEPVIVNDAYADPRFNRSVDGQTGYTTRNILCVPLRTLKDEKIGVAQLLNKDNGGFTQEDLKLLEAIVQQAAIFLENHRTLEGVEKARQQELEFLRVVSEISSELKLRPLLQKLIATITRMLDAERSTLFINDEKTNELFTEVGEGLGASQIRFPNSVGIAGTVFTTLQTVNIPYAYSDLRFNPSFDRRTGFFTRSILCVPVINKAGKPIGVTQVLNKRGGAFTEEDEARLKAFTSQISIGLENAKLFDEVQNMKNYNEGILESMSSGVVTFDVDRVITTCNAAAYRILRNTPQNIIKKSAAAVFDGPNAWVLERMQAAEEKEAGDVSVDAKMVFGGENVSANLTVLPLSDVNGNKLGSMLMIEDITSEKRLKSTMSRYMDASLADKLLETGQELLGGLSNPATVLFSDIRSFTTLTEELGAQATVSLLNEYFTLMVDCIQNQGGMLDKFIGDAIMAVFGTPIAHDDDEDRAVRTAIQMLKDLEMLNARRTSEGKKPIYIGIGLNTDTVISGNIGSPKRMDYTVIGDGVNLASRLESACKQYGSRILISEFTFKKLRGTYRTREVDRVIVKGKTQPVSVFEVMDFYTEETFPNIIDVLGAFRDGLVCYRNQKWDDSVAAFKRALHANPSDYASKMYIKRCELLKETPPAKEWNGVWTLESK